MAACSERIENCRGSISKSQRNRRKRKGEIRFRKSGPTSYEKATQKWWKTSFICNQCGVEKWYDIQEWLNDFLPIQMMSLKQRKRTKLRRKMKCINADSVFIHTMTSTQKRSSFLAFTSSASTASLPFRRKFVQSAAIASRTKMFTRLTNQHALSLAH